jgi:hypothetical protein
MTTQKHNWTTEKGANIEMTITIEQVNFEKEINADGNIITVIKQKITNTINEFKLNGTSFEANYNYSTIEFEVNGRKAKVYIPEEIKTQIYEAHYAFEAQKDKESDEYIKGYNKVMEAMNI